MIRGVISDAVVWKDVDPDVAESLADACADVASYVWEPLLRRAVYALADAAADVEGWEREAVAILTDPVMNPVVWEGEPGE